MNVFPTRSWGFVFAGIGLGVLSWGGVGCRTLMEKQAGEAKRHEGSERGKAEAPDWNMAVLRAIEKLPIGGGYAVHQEARQALQAAVAWEDDKPSIRPAAAQPSFCSGATYLSLVILLAQEQKGGKLSLSPEVWRQLMVEGQPDGEGVWGRWNANGPGTARLFHELGVGRNFTEWSQARPGDFLKIFWNDAIGAAEKGHSVVFLERGMVEGEDMVAFWSSNQPGGYGVKQVPFSKIRRAIFSRLERPQNFSRVLELPPNDPLLTSLIKGNVEPSVAAKACGLKGL